MLLIRAVAAAAPLMLACACAPSQPAGTCSVATSTALPVELGDCRWTPSIAADEAGEVRALWAISYPDTCFEAHSTDGGATWAVIRELEDCNEPQILASADGWAVDTHGCLQIEVDGEPVNLGGCYHGPARRLAAWASSPLTALLTDIGDDGYGWNDLLYTASVASGAAVLSPLAEDHESPVALDIAAGPDGATWVAFIADQETWLLGPDGVAEPIGAHLGGDLRQLAVAPDGRVLALAEHDWTEYVVATRGAEGDWSSWTLPAPTPHFGDCPSPASEGDLCPFERITYASGAVLASGPAGVRLVALRSHTTGTAEWRCDLQSAAPPPDNTYCDWDASVVPVRTLVVADPLAAAPELVEVTGFEAAHWTASHGVALAADGSLHVAVSESTGGGCAAQMLHVSCGAF